jgi:hypothetical protein
VKIEIGRNKYQEQKVQVNPGVDGVHGIPSRAKSAEASRVTTKLARQLQPTADDPHPHR